MIVAPPRAEGERPRRRLNTVDQLAHDYKTPKSTLYDYLRRNPQAGVLRIGKKILVDVDVFDAHISGAK